MHMLTIDCEGGSSYACSTTHTPRQTKTMCHCLLPAFAFFGGQNLTPWRSESRKLGAQKKPRSRETR